MPSPQPPTWQSMFVGREAELENLKQAWEKAKSGDPQLVVLLAETGMGKTRLVQQFYTWLSQHEDLPDPEGYWPDWLARESNSLSVNPDFEQDRQAAMIPWLWWGIRFTNPNLRNRAEISECGMVNALPHLNPHFVSLQKSKEIRGRSTSMGTDLLTSLGGLLGLATLGPIAGAVISGIGAASALKDGVSVLQNARKVYRIKKNEKGIADLRQEQQKSAVDRLQAYFEALLSKDKKGKGAIPIILIIDDAQWADIDTLLLIERLYHKAVKNNWPLMVLGTHWEREWHQQTEQSLKLRERNEPLSVADLVKRNWRTLDPSWKPWVVGKIDEIQLEGILTHALPGLTAEQREQILSLTGGNPGFFIDLITYLINDECQSFEQENPCNALTPEGAAMLSEFLVDLDHYQLNRKRFKLMEPHLQNLLAWGSHQGTRFIESLTLEIARRLKPDQPNDVHYLHQAQRPHALIESISRLSSEFRQRSIHEIANKELQKRGSYFRNFRKTLLEILQEWQSGEQYQQLDNAEQAQWLQLLVGELNTGELTKERRATLGRVLAKLIEHYHAEGQQRLSAETARQLVAVMPEHGWDFGVVDEQIWWRGAAMLHEYSWHRDSIKLWDSLIYQIKLETGTETPNREEVAERQNGLAGAYMNRGVALKNQNQLAPAIESYNRAIELREALRESLGEEWPPVMQNDLASAYMNRGVALADQNQLAPAIESYDRAIELRERLRESQGDEWPPAMQNDLARAYCNRGNALKNQNQLEPAIESCDRAIELMKRLRELQGEEWPPAMQDDLASAYTNRGIALADQNQLAPAIKSYDRAIELMKRLRESQGDEWPPAMQDDLASAYTNRGVALKNQNQLAPAIKSYDRAIELREGLRESQGEEWPPAMQDGLAGTYMNRGNALVDQNQLAPAIESYDRAIELGERLRESQGEEWPPAMQNDLARAYINRGNALANQSQLSPAIESYDRAIALRERLREALGEEWPPAMQNDLASAYINRGVALADQNQLAPAIESYNRAIALNEPLLFEAKYPPALQTLATSHLFHTAMLLDQPELQPNTAELIERARLFHAKVHEQLDLSELPEAWTAPLAKLAEILGI